MSYRRYFTGIAVVVGVLGSLYAGLFAYQVGAPVKAAYWLRELKVVKNHIARSAEGRKIVIAGGSNALFGIDSELLEKSLGVRTVNLSLHAGFPVEYHFDFVRPHLRRGDILVFSPEFEMLSRGKPYNKWYTTQLLSWDGGYFRGLDPVEKFRVIRRVKPGRVRKGARTMMRKDEIYERKRGRAPVPEEDVLRRMKQIWESGKYRGLYSVENIGPRGDIARNRGSFKGNAGRYGLGKRYRVAGRTRKALAEFREYCRERGIRFLYAWPPTIGGEELDLGDDGARAALGGVREFFRGLEIPVLGEPGDFSYGRSFFFDTKYHLNAEGRRMRSERMADLLEEHVSPE